MITELCFMQSTRVVSTPSDAEGSLQISVKAEGITILITFTPSNDSQAISVYPIEVTACAEPGMYILVMSINQQYIAGCLQ